MASTQGERSGGGLLTAWLTVWYAITPIVGVVVGVVLLFAAGVVALVLFAVVALFAMSRIGRRTEYQTRPD